MSGPKFLVLVKRCGVACSAAGKPQRAHLLLWPETDRHSCGTQATCAWLMRDRAGSSRGS